MKLIVLNLADNNQNGLVSTVVRTIKRKYSRGLRGIQNKIRIFGTNSVIEYNLIPMLDGHSPKLDQQDVSTAEISQHCTGADRVIVALHGNYDKRDQGLVKMGVGEEVTVTLGRLTDIIGNLLPQGNSYELTLLMCYGARTVTYCLDHFAGTVDWSTSFAYRFYEHLTDGRDIRMVAFTGAVRVDSEKERFQIQTELAVQSDIQLKDMAQTLLATQEKWNTLLAQSNDADQVAYNKMLDQFVDPRNTTSPSVEPRLQAGYRIAKDWAYFNRLMMDQETKEFGTGKIVFIRRQGKTVVLTHHPRLRFLYPPEMATH